jgi:hypothetical protein
MGGGAWSRGGDVGDVGDLRINSIEADSSTLRLQARPVEAELFSLWGFGDLVILA